MTRYQALQPHEQRVVAEYKELREWHAKLCAFIASGTFITLPEEDRELMVIQENLMDSLSFVLARRIRRFTALGVKASAEAEDIELPPLPEPDGSSEIVVDQMPEFGGSKMVDVVEHVDAWTESLVRDFARQAVLADRRRNAGVGGTDGR